MSRAQKYVSAANKVYVIAPRGNRYWPEWSSYLNDQKGYRTTYHDWCGLDVCDKAGNLPAALKSFGKEQIRWPVAGKHGRDLANVLDGGCRSP